MTRNAGSRDQTHRLPRSRPSRDRWGRELIRPLVVGTTGPMYCCHSPSLNKSRLGRLGSAQGNRIPRRARHPPDGQLPPPGKMTRRLCPRNGIRESRSEPNRIVNLCKPRRTQDHVSQIAMEDCQPLTCGRSRQHQSKGIPQTIVFRSKQLGFIETEFPHPPLKENES